MKQLFILLAAKLLTTAGFAQPPAKHHEAVALDPKSNAIAVFGGAEMVNNEMKISNSTWIYDGKWQAVADASLTPRWNSGLTYHQKSLFLYGGLSYDNTKQETALSDMYVLKNNKWQYLTNGPTLHQPQLLSIRSTLWLVGKTPGNSSTVEAWRFDPVSKTLVPEHTTKLADADASFIVCDKDGDLVIVQVKDSTLVLKNLNNETQNMEIKLATSISKYSVVYDNKQKAFFLFGDVNAGRTDVSAFWKIDGYVVEPVKFDAGPKAKSSAHLLAANNGIYLFGGVESGRMTNELWHFSSGSWKEMK